MYKSNIKNLKDADLYSLMLFALYRMTDIPEYSSLSQMAYVLDKDNLLNFCEYFGGQTITIPTTKDLESLIYSLLLYQYVRIDNMDYDEACDLIGHQSSDLRKVKRCYRGICDVLDKYTFKPQSGV